MSDDCPNCGKEYESLSQHWGRAKNCHYPEFPEELQDISVGLLMGDGCLYRNYKNPILAVKCIQEDYLKELSDTFGAFGNSVTFVNTGKKQESYSREYASDNPNFNDVYRWLSRSHPYYHKLAEWYSGGEKTWPENIDMKPKTLKHWYAGDGDLTDGERIRISSVNEENLEKISTYFRRVGLPEPKRTCHRFYWTREESKILFEYMGDPPTGYEYKWV